MDEFDVFYYDLEFSDGTGSKVRPVAVLKLHQTNTSLVGIYSYRKWFNNSNEFYEILDLDEVGLNRRSFVKLSKIAVIDDLYHDKYEIVGHLSKNDISGLSKSLENYYN
jgi:hypothetical protein